MQITRNTVASIDYTLTDVDGQVIDTSEGREPVTYLHGSGNLIPGLESALEGQSAGDTLAVEVAPAEAYGERDERLVQNVPRSAFDGVERVEAGMRFHATDPNGRRHAVTVTDIRDDKITVDANHPLAGKPLNFEVSVVEVRAATPAEIANGDVAKQP